MKYIVIFIALTMVWWIWRFVDAVIERGLPTHPVYYISSVVGITFGFLIYSLLKKNDKEKITKRRYVLIPLLVIVVAIAFRFSGVFILQQIGSGFFYWYVLAGTGFYCYYLLKNRGSKKELVEAEQTVKNVSKGLGIFLLVMAILLAPLIIFCIVMANLF